jgi:hypothetical protein
MNTEANNDIVETQTPSTSSNISDSYHPQIVVDGKTKKISKKSAFLLDMLTLDDE